jgi:hypothetical protein
MEPIRYSRIKVGDGKNKVRDLPFVKDEIYGYEEHGSS